MPSPDTALQMEIFEVRMNALLNCDLLYYKFSSQPNSLWFALLRCCKTAAGLADLCRFEFSCVPKSPCHGDGKRMKNYVPTDFQPLKKKKKSGLSLKR